MTLRPPYPSSIEIVDRDGSGVQLHATGVLLGDCQECKSRCIALSNRGQMRCTHCGGAVKWAWNRPQLSFLPESDGAFLGWDRGKNARKGTKKR